MTTFFMFSKNILAFYTRNNFWFNNNTKMEEESWRVKVSLCQPQTQPKARFYWWAENWPKTCEL